VPDVPSTQTLVRDGDGFKLRSHKLHIEVTAGPDAPQTLVLPGPEARVGAGPDCDLVLQDPTVSKHHVTLRVDRRGVRVIDAGSRNGTLVDGLQVLDAYARPDSQIVVGGSTLRLKLISDVVELPLSSKTRFGSLIGRSVPMKRLFSVLERVAPTDTTVLIEGETGTGKELIAEAVHEHSQASEGPFVVFDCSAVSPTLMESELFGHVRGAFTGASSDRMGALEAADGGTLFLDEIGELPLDLQPKLLRALEKLEVRRVGSHEARRVQVRIVAATNRSLEREVEAGRFREDLYYRLAVVRVPAPPLRERAEDIPMLIEHFVTQFADRHGNASHLPEQTVQAFASMAWPGNVRELRNAVARAMALGPPRELRTTAEIAAATSASFQPQVDTSVPLKLALERVTDDFERAYIEELLRAAGGNITRAAEMAGVNRKYLHRAITRLGIRGG
jgi:transcriptional regulator with GAF, ATPase, and Fis domain